MKLKTLLFGLVVISFFSASAVPLVTYSFTGSAGSEVSFAADLQPTDATASAMTRGSGLTPAAAGGAFSSSAWTLSTSIDVNDYYSFSLTPDSGFSMTLAQLIFDERRSLTGIRNWAVRSSLDGYGSDLSTFAVPDNDATRTSQTINLSPAFAGLTSVLEFRIYGYGAEASGGTWRIDNVKVEGLTQPLLSVPDAGNTIVLLAISCCWLVMVRRCVAGSLGNVVPSCV